MHPIEFKRTIIELVKNSIEKGNKTQTTLNNLSRFLNSNSESLIDPTYYKGVWKDEYERLERFRIFFENYNNGLYRFINSSLRIRVSLIIMIYAQGEKFYVIIPDDHTGPDDSKHVRYSCSKMDYDVLNMIMQYGK